MTAPGRFNAPACGPVQIRSAAGAQLPHAAAQLASQQGAQGHAVGVADLRGDLDNIVPTTTANPAFWQHMVTFGISIGLKGSLNPDTDLPALTAGTRFWPNPNDNEDFHRIDDLFHASVNGRGSFIAAGDPNEFTSGLKAALATITERTGSFSNVAANSARLQTGTTLFQASYVSGVWTGELVAYDRLTPPQTGFAATPTWRSSNGIPATGKRVSIAGITILRFGGGKVVERWSQSDFLGLLQQLGALPGAGPQ